MLASESPFDMHACRRDASCDKYACEAVPADCVVSQSNCCTEYLQKQQILGDCNASSVAERLDDMQLIPGKAEKRRGLHPWCSRLEQWGMAVARCAEPGSTALSQQLPEVATSH